MSIFSPPFRGPCPPSNAVCLGEVQSLVGCGAPREPSAAPGFPCSLPTPLGMKQSSQKNERGSRTEVLKPCSLRRRCQASDHSNDRRTYSRVYPRLFSYKPILPAAGQCFLQLLRCFVEQDLRLAFKSYKNLSVWEPGNTCPGTHCRAPCPSAW